jgi:hypothetical protein
MILRARYCLQGVILLISLVLSTQIALSNPITFNEFFSKQKEIKLSTSGLRISDLWSFAADAGDRLYILDARGRQLIVFDNDGRFIARIGGHGQGPGEYMVPGAAYIDTSNRIYIVDTQSRRINIYETGGRFLESFLLNSSHGPGNIVTDSEANVFLGGLGVPASPGVHGDWLHKYDSRGRFVRSFFKDMSGQMWFVMLKPNFLFDIHEDVIYAMQINRYNIHVLDNDGDLVRSFNRAPRYYRGPDENYVMDEKKFPSLEKLKDELYRLMRSWTMPQHLEIVSPGVILVQSSANGLVAGCSKKYIIDLWSTQGDLIAEAIPCDHRFLCSDRKGNCYILISTDQDEALDKDPEYIIGKYSLTLPKK